MNDGLAECEFRNADGEIVKGRDALEDKLLGLYFSAHWCIWCRRFTPILKEFYEQLGNDELEIVFVSADKSEAALMKYYREAQGKWLYLPYGSDNIDELWRKYEVRTMPTLVIVRPSGEVITRNGVSHLKSRTTPQEMLRQWKSGEIVERTRKCSIM